MFHDYEAMVTVGPGGRIELTLPDASPGVQVHVAVREPDAQWAQRLREGTLRGPSLSDETLGRESIYAEDAT